MGRVAQLVLASVLRLPACSDMGSSPDRRSYLFNVLLIERPMSVDRKNCVMLIHE